MQWSVRALSPVVHAIEWDDCEYGDTFSVLLRSDVHHDNAHTDRSIEKAHAEKALAIDAPILDNGDYFCAMQNKGDKRSSRSAMRDENFVNAYFTSLVDTAADFNAPFASVWALKGRGNHETKAIDKHGIDLTAMLCDKMRLLHGTAPMPARYAGFVLFKFRMRSGSTRMFRMYRHHGFGGGGYASLGVIQTSRTQTWVKNADAIWTGHTHDAWMVPRAIAQCSDKGKFKIDVCWHLRTSGYKDEFGPQSGWAVERGMQPKPKSAIWLRLRPVREGVEAEPRWCL